MFDTFFAYTGIEAAFAPERLTFYIAAAFTVFFEESAFTAI